MYVHAPSVIYRTICYKENGLRDPLLTARQHLCDGKFSLLIVYSNYFFFLINHFCFFLSYLFLSEDGCRGLENRSGLSFLYSLFNFDVAKKQKNVSTRKSIYNPVNFLFLLV